MAMMHNSLLNYYETIFAFKQYHQWSISEIYEMIPWELEVMTSLLGNYIETKKLKENQRISSINS